MSRNIFFKTGLLVIGSLMILQFQNCSQLPAETTMSSQEMTVDHMDNDHGLPSTKPAVDYSPVLMDRWEVYSLLTDIFGPDSLAVQVNKNALEAIVKDMSVFGAPCSINDNYKTKNVTTGALANAPSADACSNSDTGVAMGAAIHPGGNVLRQGVLNNACRVLLDQAKTLDYALAQLKDAPADVLPLNSDANVLKLFRLFYRTQPLPAQSLVDSLKVIVGSPATKDGWKNAVYTTCVSSHWQVL